MNQSLSEKAKQDRRKMRKVYEKAYVLFLDKLEVIATLDNFPLPYDLCKKAKEASWPNMQWANLMVSEELSETINQLNGWCKWLMHLSAWTDVLEHLEEHDAWTIQAAYVDPLAHACLTQPSAVRDRFGYIATNAIHQADLGCIDSYKDNLEQDAQKQPLSRKKLELQIKKIGKYWKSTALFIDALQDLDSEDFRHATRNYRNLASHAIAPRFRFGITNFVVRKMGFPTSLVQQTNGTYLEVEHPSEKVVCYGLGGTDALNLNDVYILTLSEFNKTVKVFSAYSMLLEEILASL